MKILLINGSPRGGRSNTLKISRAFVSGFDQCETEELDICRLNILPCRGCFSCWGKTAGSCVLKDDMDMIRLKIRLSDIIIESFPLYFFGMPSQIKAMTDRCLPMMLPYSGKTGENSEVLFHELRDKEMKKKKLVVISSCGYAETKTMYPSVVNQFDLICGKGGYTSIFCAQGELFFSGMAERQSKAYLALVKEAGREFCETGKISGELRRKLDKPLLSPKGFETVTKGHSEWFPVNSEQIINTSDNIQE